MRVLVIGSSPAALALLAALLAAPTPAAADNDDSLSAFTEPPIQVFTITRHPMVDLPKVTLAIPPLPALPKAPRQLGACHGCHTATPTNPNGPHTGPPRR